MFRLESAAVALALALSLLPGATTVFAQDTREAVLERKRAEKASTVVPYKPGKLEKALLWYEKTDPLERLSPHDGFYLQYGFQFKPTGAGLGLGGGYRHDLFDRLARVDVGGGITTRNYQMLMGDFSLPYLADDRLEVGARVLYRHNPQEDFWGIGPDSLQDDRVSYRVDYTNLEGRVIANPIPWIEAGARLGSLSGSVGSGTDSRFPSIEERFTDATAPGLAIQPDYRYGEVFGGIDFRDQPNNARAGGLYSLTWRRYADLDFDRYSFGEVDLLLQHFFPIFDKKRVIAVQGRLLSTHPGDDQIVPFYFQPTLGGSTSLRGFNDFRFRDNAASYVNLEYRWEAFSFLDMALFSDWGTVAPAVDELRWSSMKNAYGLGLRFNNYKSVFYRIDLGFGGGEGVHYFFKFSKAF
jgi:outer membrane protein assembly factor BamA